MSCAMVYWGGNFERFSKVFLPYGAVVNIENLKGVRIGHAHNPTANQLEFADLEQAPAAPTFRAGASS